MSQEEKRRRPDLSALAPDLLAGRCAWITGGGTGLGRAMALRLSELGARVGLSGRRQEPLEQTAGEIRANGGQAEWACCDVREPEPVEAAFRELNDAAVVGIVLHGTFHCTSTAGRHWIASKTPGVVLNIVTTYAWTGSAYVLPSACAKAGVLAMTRSLAVEWGRHDIRLNAIAPGPIPTAGAFSRLLPTEQLVKDRTAHIPAGRMGVPEELAQLAAFLVSDAADWIRGEVVTLDGGEWLRGAGEFNFMLDLDIPWEKMR